MQMSYTDSRAKYIRAMANLISAQKAEPDECIAFYSSLVYNSSLIHDIRGLKDHI